MRRVSVGCILAAVALVVLVARPAHAQKVVVAAGWAPTWWLSPGGTTTTVPVAAMFNVAGTVFPQVQVVGDLGYTRKAGGTHVTGTGGVRFVIPAPATKASPFVEALAGVGYLTASGNGGSDTGLAYGAGAGVDCKVAPVVAVRLQFDYFRVQHFGVGYNQLRVGIGISLAPRVL
jgi:opacity protein-like surface antigen